MRKPTPAIFAVAISDRGDFLAVLAATLISRVADRVVVEAAADQVESPAAGVDLAEAAVAAGGGGYEADAETLLAIAMAIPRLSAIGREDSRTASTPSCSIRSETRP